MMRIQVERGREGKTGQQCFIFFQYLFGLPPPGLYEIEASFVEAWRRPRIGFSMSSLMKDHQPRGSRSLLRPFTAGG